MQDEAERHPTAHQEPAPRGSAVPPLPPEVEREWRSVLNWWENQAAGSMTLEVTAATLLDAQSLLASLASTSPRSSWWEELPEDRWRGALLAAMAQFRAISPLSNSYEPNRRVLPPLSVCLRVLQSAVDTSVKELVYLILQKGEYPLNTARREELQKHFDQLVATASAPAVALQTAARLNFKGL
jgi:hypothetical protein